MTNKRVCTLQDISCLGQCSITVALPIISACGVETIIMPAAVLSTHTGEFTGYTIRDLSDDLPGIMNHWMKEGQIFDCLYTGYLANITQIEFVSELRKNVITEDGLLIVDPAMADNGRLYAGFDSEFVSHMAGLCGKADIILPNITEASLMTGIEYVGGLHNTDYIETLLNRLSSLGAKKIVLKGIHFEENKIGVAVYDSDTSAIQYYFTDKIGNGTHGTGDCYAAAFTGSLMQGYSVYESAKTAADFVVDCIKATIDDKSHWYGVKFEKALPGLVAKVNKQI